MSGVPGDLARWVGGLVEGRRGVLVQQKRERQVYALPGAPPATHWAKRGRGGKRAEVRREAAHARRLEAAGLGPAVVASGAFEDAEWLVVEDAGRSVRAVGRDHLGDVLTVVAAAVRRLHDARLTLPDLSADHTFLDGRVLFIDPARMKSHATRPGAAEQAASLAAFLASLGVPAGGPSRARRVRFVRDATGLRGEALRDLLRRVDARLARVALRTRWRHGFLADSGAFLAEFLRARGEEPEGLPATDPLDDRAAMPLVRALPDRENRTLGTGPDGRPLFFVKLFPPTRRGWSPAMREVASIDLFQRKGLLVNRLAAYAEDADKGSLVAVHGCAGEPLDDLLRGGTVTAAERRALAVQTARIWRRMRESGLRHRDAYPCHLFVARTDTPPRFELRLIDLTRAGEAPWPRERWFVKDAAALWHGLPKPPVTRTDAVRWLREYFRVPKLTRAAKRFARAVAAKERRVAARQARKRGTGR